ncbi:MAG: helix-turn-helix domain-containing protein [Synergistaceae bacterium]|jgi:transcriptional regulator with XRE-family HTH domain|nr:helix-turn-helix domain-containing protein [Synergistaceae bacterium]
MMRRDLIETGRENVSEIKRLGGMLKALREAQGLTYDDVSLATHMRPHIIQAIENGTIESVSAPVYARGFIKTYCEYLMASDLWKKYSQGKLFQDDSGELVTEDDEEPVDIQHPTPIFRRSSIVWVYIILVMAVTGAAYLLWSQRRESGQENPLFLRLPGAASFDISAVSPLPGGASLGMISGDVEFTASDGEEFMEILPIPAPRSPGAIVSSEGAPVVSGDLSWMYATSESGRPMPELPYFIDRTLLIEITGSNNKLTVTQGGKIVTRRTLSIGGRRSYDVASDVRVTLSSGNKARVTWFGKRYESIGSDNSALTLTFHPDGSVDLLSGRSPHFAPGVQ